MPQIISPAQALLLLMEKFSYDPELQATFKKWYLNGINVRQHYQFRAYCRELENYTVNFSSKIISEDPSKRYFETHLAHATIKHHLKYLELAQLNELFRLLKIKIDEGIAAQEPESRPKHEEVIRTILRGEYREENSNLFNEYAILIQRIQIQNLFAELSDDEREKILLITQIAFMSTLSTTYHNETLPLGIYGRGIYSQDSRGRKLKSFDEYSLQQTPAMGIMKSYMPLYHVDIARKEPTQALLRASDQSFYKPGAAWTNHNFSLLVHPFSNSISGTILCQLRNMLYFAQTGHFPFMHSQEEFKAFIRVFVSILLYGLGGHSLFEFMAPFEVLAVQKKMSFLIGRGPFDIEKLFLHGNEDAFAEALANTQSYHHKLLLKSAIHRDLNDQMKEFQAQQKDEISVIIRDLDTKYQTKIHHQMFVKYRNLSDKQRLIHRACEAGITALATHDLDEACRIISQLKQDFERIYGRTLSRSRVSRGWTMINEAEQEIIAILNRSFKFKHPKK